MNRKAILYVYLGQALLIQVCLIVLVLNSGLTPGQFLTASTLLLNGLAALMIRPEGKAEEVKVEGETVDVTETGQEPATTT